MTKYKLIKEYPGSPKLGTIAERISKIKSNTSYYYGEGEKRYCIYDHHVEDNPEYWEKFNEYLWYAVFEKPYIQDDKEYFSPWNIYMIETLEIQSNDRYLFKTREEAEEFIIDNKPCLSYTDIMWNFLHNTKKDNVSIDIGELIKLIKSKL